jgi:hypothetical protein
MLHGGVVIALAKLNDSTTANAEAGAIAILEGAKTSLTSAIPSMAFSDQASAIFLPQCNIDYGR